MSYEPLRKPEVNAVIEAADRMGARDSLMIRLLFHTGARIGEICPLVAGDVDPVLGDVHLGRDLVVLKHLIARHPTRKRTDGTPRFHYNQKRRLSFLEFDAAGLTGEVMEGVPGEIWEKVEAFRTEGGEVNHWAKGGYGVKRGLKANEPVRTVPLADPPTRALLHESIQGRKRTGWILPSNKGGFLTYIGAYKRVKKAMIAGGVSSDDPRCHPHVTRHSYAVDKLLKGMPLPILQRILGHADISTTAIYLRFVIDDLRDAAEKAGAY